jgi:16S rRNA (cytidine1402-2'-O)-methyltransferase
VPGTLYIVATPIGNLEDITYRAVRVLGEVDMVACEDTRQTRKLLDHYGITTRTVSYHEHNEAARAGELVGELEAGANIALVTDAGTPLVSDPGFRIVERAAAAGIAVVPVPGASAVLAALAGSGLPSSAFGFWGFLPAKAGQRRKILTEVARDNRTTLVFYEAPHRIVESLADIVDVCGAGRPVVAARELTKLHEEFLRGTAAEVHRALAERVSIRGEFTLVIGPAGGGEEGSREDRRPLAEQVAELIGQGIGRMDAIKEVARRNQVGKREVYQAVEASGD